MYCITLASLRTDDFFNLESVSQRNVNISAVQVLVETLWPSSLAASRHTCTYTAPQERYRTRPRAATIPAELSVAQVTSHKPHRTLHQFITY